MGRASWSFVAGGCLVVGCGGAAAGPAPAAPANGAPASQEAAVPPPAGPPTSIDCGDFTTCAIAQGGEVRCWGRDKTGELGDGAGADRAKNVPVPGVAKATKVAMGSQFACALLEDKSVKCWGTGRIANDGKPLTNARATPVASLSNVDELAASGVLACARAGTSVTCWGADASTIGTAPATGKFTQIATGFSHACALEASGAVTCWGTGDWAPKAPLAKATVSGAKLLATGDRHVCVIAKDKRVMCWGRNDAGQLGTKADGDLHKTPTAVPGVANASKLVAGESSTCAVLEDGTAKCWGQNTQGELGLGSKSSDERPQKIATSSVADVCIATTHGCALKRDGTITCWGGNAHGQLGDGSKDAKTTPSSVAW